MRSRVWEGSGSTRRGPLAASRGGSSTSRSGARAQERRSAAAAGPLCGGRDALDDVRQRVLPQEDGRRAVSVRELGLRARREYRQRWRWATPPRVVRRARARAWSARSGSWYPWASSHGRDAQSATVAATYSTAAQLRARASGWAGASVRRRRSRHPPPHPLMLSSVVAGRRGALKQTNGASAHPKTDVRIVAAVGGAPRPAPPAAAADRQSAARPPRGSGGGWGGSLYPTRAPRARAPTSYGASRSPAGARALPHNQSPPLDHREGMVYGQYGLTWASPLENPPIVPTNQAHSGDHNSKAPTGGCCRMRPGTLEEVEYCRL